ISIDPKSSLGKFSVMQPLAVAKANYHIAQKDDVYRDWVAKLPRLVTVTSGEEFLEKGVVAKGQHIKPVVFNAFARSILLELSLIIGIVHITLSLLRYLWRHWAGIGWIAFMLGAYLFFPSVLKATSIVNF